MRFHSKRDSICRPDLRGLGGSPNWPFAEVPLPNHVAEFGGNIQTVMKDLRDAASRRHPVTTMLQSFDLRSLGLVPAGGLSESKGWSFFQCTMW
jgi:hypothetical protein